MVATALATTIDAATTLLLHRATTLAATSIATSIAT
eukprot:CAMPEP_0196679740 /NCGR_PEP_ID=MMETSP1090-20130531/7299_1 /TAXON_ID=37098 /ORGANISM="Isochrysis sp, Strain CCMP1244" /LENGTH=35 /DNA_ID= /DNA_START= /DNA_END= /DNA_ORIENTATION=